WLIDQK
ncbi:unnamed protein product, partial [Allacma fusca]